MVNYKLSNEAKNDLIRIHHFGVEIFGMIQADFIRTGYRRCVCGSDSIYYRINDGRVEIMAIISRQDFK
jgi:toxin ParE1/3/4